MVDFVPIAETGTRIDRLRLTATKTAAGVKIECDDNIEDHVLPVPSAIVDCVLEERNGVVGYALSPTTIGRAAAVARHVVETDLGVEAVLGLAPGSEALREILTAPAISLRALLGRRVTEGRLAEVTITVTRYGLRVSGSGFSYLLSKRLLERSPSDLYGRWSLIPPPHRLGFSGGSYTVAGVPVTNEVNTTFKVAADENAPYWTAARVEGTVASGFEGDKVMVAAIRLGYLRFRDLAPTTYAANVTFDIKPAIEPTFWQNESMDGRVMTSALDGWSIALHVAGDNSVRVFGPRQAELTKMLDKHLRAQTDYFDAVSEPLTTTLPANTILVGDLVVGDGPRVAHDSVISYTSPIRFVINDSPLINGEVVASLIRETRWERLRQVLGPLTGFMRWPSLLDGQKGRIVWPNGRFNLAPILLRTPTVAVTVVYLGYSYKHNDYDVNKDHAPRSHLFGAALDGANITSPSHPWPNVVPAFYVHLLADDHALLERVTAPTTVSRHNGLSDWVDFVACARGSPPLYTCSSTGWLAFTKTKSKNRWGQVQAYPENVVTVAEDGEQLTTVAAINALPRVSRDP